jgi:hypothetical protein
VRVYRDHDLGSWFIASDRPHLPTAPLKASGLAGAQSAAEAAMAASGLTPVTAWSYTGTDETGAQAVFSQPGSGDVTRTHLRALWAAHRALLARLGVDVAALPTAQRALLFSQDVMLVGLAKSLLDKGILSPDDLRTATSAVAAADLTWLTGS